jgi:hypothetical protein
MVNKSLPKEPALNRDIDVLKSIGAFLIHALYVHVERLVALAGVRLKYALALERNLTLRLI